MKTPREYREAFQDTFGNEKWGEKFWRAFICTWDWFDEDCYDDPDLGQYIVANMRKFGFINKETGEFTVPDINWLKERVSKYSADLVDIIYEEAEDIAFYEMLLEARNSPDYKVIEDE